uniref:Mitochondrial 28S ribosomal protein S22 n=1 Tax=Glossina morsitans morsitans TaxID=37546 RepID=A0A1B0FP52_GLOMM
MSLYIQLNVLNKIRGTLTKNAFRTQATKSVTVKYDKDPQPLFTDPEIQKLLKSITQLDLSKIFRRTTASVNSVEYKFMTTEQLEDVFRKTVEKAKLKLQMPPIVKVRDDAQKIISVDKALKGFSDTKFVITDVTYGTRQSERKVIVRDTDGTLHHAPMEMAKRMKQLFVPLNGRKLRTPQMFEEENLERRLEERKYEFILDRLLVQFDPDEPDFHRISSKVYQHINETKEFDQLRSTRHFGPMAFFYVWHKCIDDLLYDMIKRDYLRNGAELIILYYKVHSIPEDVVDFLQKLGEQNSLEDLALRELNKSIKNKVHGDIHSEIESAIGKSAKDFEVDELCLRFIEKYVAAYALKKVQLELGIQTLKEINAEKKHLYEGLSKAHGIQSVG